MRKKRRVSRCWGRQPRRHHHLLKSFMKVCCSQVWNSVAAVTEVLALKCQMRCTVNMVMHCQRCWCCCIRSKCGINVALGSADVVLVQTKPLLLARLHLLLLPLHHLLLPPARRRLTVTQAAAAAVAATAMRKRRNRRRRPSLQILPLHCLTQQQMLSLLLQLPCLTALLKSSLQRLLLRLLHPLLRHLLPLLIMSQVAALGSLAAKAAARKKRHRWQSRQHKCLRFRCLTQHHMRLLALTWQLQRLTNVQRASPASQLQLPRLPLPPRHRRPHLQLHLVTHGRAAALAPPAAAATVKRTKRCRTQHLRGF